MALLKEFEENIEVVVEILENCSEVIDQQFIYEDLGTKKIKGITLKTSLGKGLKEKAVNKVSVAMYMGSLCWKNAFNEILMWLNRYMPQFKRQIEQQYFNIVSQLNAILSVQQDLQYCGLLDLKNKIGKLVNDLRYCAKMAREELKPEPDDPEEPNDLITLAVVIQDYEISRAQLKRDIANGTPRSYRKKPRGKHKVSRKEVDNLYTKRQPSIP